MKTPRPLSAFATLASLSLSTLSTALVACAHSAPVSPARGPAEAPERFAGLIGEYDSPLGIRLVLEDSGRLFFADTIRTRTALAERSAGVYSIAPAGAQSLLGTQAAEVRFQRAANGYAQAAVLGDTRLPRRQIEPQPGTNQLRVTPVRPVDALRAEALAASPPHEDGSFDKPDLVELTSLDASIKLEIRYATTNNFLGARFYDEARAFMQRPAAEAVVRAHRALAAMGYGLLIHDAYRPWYVTKMFWDATPVDKRWLVANPVPGSRHNRGAAVDLTLYDLATGQPVVMPSTYDESTDRAHADYPGGTAAQRWRRRVLRQAMEAQGFTVNPNEWWHFDYRNWSRYPILDVPFGKLK